MERVERWKITDPNGYVSICVVDVNADEAVEVSAEFAEKILCRKVACPSTHIPFAQVAAFLKTEGFERLEEGEQ